MFLASLASIAISAPWRSLCSGKFLCGLGSPLALVAKLLGWHVCGTKLPPKNVYFDTKKGLQKSERKDLKNDPKPVRKILSPSQVIDLLMGLFRGAVFHHGGVPENCPLALMGRFPSLMGRFLTLMGRFPECLNGPFSLLKIPWKTAH